ncbi:SsgA family sporulation/cell division regulator [Streptomyces sp. NPDC088775]|uniref:SsgA family sporulation/cell division regulator n=1 Tax=Streptomyces sp. NPDC088775 TaxID=3365896 RepID=UPI0038074AF5
MSTDVQEPVSTAFAMRLHMPQPHPCFVITAFLHYALEDPYAVRIVFRMSTGDEPVVWHVNRDLIRDGLVRLAGEGDVQIGPDPGNADDVVFRLRVDDASAVLTAPRAPIEDFLRRTTEVVQYGRESSVPSVRAALDAELDRILTTS